MAVARRAVDLSRTLRGQAGLKIRQPLARLWLALPGRELAELDALLELVRAEANVKVVELIGDESELVDRGVKVLLPRVGKRLGAKIPEVMAAARGGPLRDPRRRLGDARRRDPRRRRGRDPGDAPPRHRGRPRRRPGRRHRHDADAGAAAPRATPASCRARSRTCARRPSWTSTTGSSCGSTASAPSWSRSSPPSPRTPSPTSCAARRRRPGCRWRPSVSRRGEARIALRRAGEALSR